MSDTKRKVQEALAEKRKQLQNIKESKKAQPTATGEPPVPVVVCTFHKIITMSQKQ
jgi:hypothetical protein